MKKVLTMSLIGGGLFAGYSYYKKLKRTKAELVVLPDATLYQVNWNGIVVRIDVVLKNPTKGSFSIKFPFIKLSYKDTVIASSHVIDKEIKIPAYGEAKIEKILVTIPMQSIFSVSTSILKAIQNKEPVKLKATVITTVNLGWTKLPYEDTKEVVLKK